MPCSLLFDKTGTVCRKKIFQIRDLLKVLPALVRVLQKESLLENFHFGYRRGVLLAGEEWTVLCKGKMI